MVNLSDRLFCSLRHSPWSNSKSKSCQQSNSTELDL